MQKSKQKQLHFVYFILFKALADAFVALGKKELPNKNKLDQHNGRILKCSKLFRHARSVKAPRQTFI